MLCPTSGRTLWTFYKLSLHVECYFEIIFRLFCFIWHWQWYTGIHTWGFTFKGIYIEMYWKILSDLNTICSVAWTCSFGVSSARSSRRAKSCWQGCRSASSGRTCPPSPSQEKVNFGSFLVHNLVSKIEWERYIYHTCGQELKMIILKAHLPQAVAFWEVIVDEVDLSICSLII